MISNMTHLANAAVQIKFVQCISTAGLHTMAYKEWGDPHNTNILVCVHGLTRVADDFDSLAAALSTSYRVICPDVVGRGRSSHLRDPQLYNIPQYVSDMVTLLAQILANDTTSSTTVSWLGTSMGGLIGMILASLPGNPIHKLILNDIGPTLNVAALIRIGEYVGQPMRFATLDEGIHFIRAISNSFGPHSDEEWHKLGRDVLRQDVDGSWIRHYDLGLAVPFQQASRELESIKKQEAILWAAYDAIQCPTLLVRGAESDLLTPDTAQVMTQRGPKATLVEIPGVGHAPTFIHSEQVAIVQNFLNAEKID